MRLVIRANSLCNELLSQTIVGEFDARGGTIGRSDSNTMALPDPERHVSRLQAEVSFAAGRFTIRNIGSSNPIIVGGRPVSPGEAVPLHHGEVMTIGGYELQVSLSDGATPPARTGGMAKAVDARTVIGASAGEGKTNPPRQVVSAPEVDPFAGLLGAAVPAGAADPFADLLGASPPRVPAAAAKPIAARAPMPSSPPPVARLPDDFDPFAEIGIPPPAAQNQGASLSEMIGDKRSAPGSLDAMFGLDAAAPQARDPLEAFLSSVPEGAASSPTDPFAFLEEG